jgi:uncharacterized protein
MPRVVHFEISADDMDRARAFYETVFGWEFKKWDGPAEYWTVTTGPNDHPGINGGLFKRKGPVGHVNTVEVPDLDDSVAKVEANGGKVVMPKMAIQGVGWLVYCQDTEESVFGVMQPDPTAR